MRNFQFAKLNSLGIIKLQEGFSLTLFLSCMLVSVQEMSIYPICSWKLGFMVFKFLYNIMQNSNRLLSCCSFATVCSWVSSVRAWTVKAQCFSGVVQRAVWLTLDSNNQFFFRTIWLMSCSLKQIMVKYLHAQLI